LDTWPGNSSRRYFREASLPSRVTETCSGSSRVRVILMAAFSDDAESAVASAMAARPLPPLASVGA
jgi:hypothetical protein